MRIIGEIATMPAIGVHHVDFPVLVPIGSEGNAFAIGGPRRKPVIIGIFSEVATIPSISIHHVNIRVAILAGHKGNLSVCISTYHQ